MAKGKATNKATDDELATGSLTDLLARMSSAGREVYDKVLELLENVDTGQLSAYYRTGQLLNDLEDRPDLYDDTHRHALAALGQERRHTAQRCQLFARRIPEKEFVDLQQARNPETGYRVTWGHIGGLITLKGARDRQRWVKKIVEQEITAKVLQTELKRLNGTEREARDSAGRPHKKPVTLDACVAQMAETFRTLNARCDSVWLLASAPETSVREDLEAVDETTVSLELYERVREAAAILSAARENVNELAIALRSASRRFAESLTERQLLDESADAAEEFEAAR